MKQPKKIKYEKNRLTRTKSILHRDLGFSMIGLTIIYIISGIKRNYRETVSPKKERQATRTIEPVMEADESGSALHMRYFEIVRTDENADVFNNRPCSDSSRVVENTSNKFPRWLKTTDSLHKTSTRSPLRWPKILYAILLQFMATSSLWMFKSGAGLLRRGIKLSAAGVAVMLINLCV